MSATAKSAATTPTADLDRAVAAVRARAQAFARLSPRAKADLLRECMPRIQEVAQGWVDAGCKAKGIDPTSHTAGEEWFGGPVITMRNTRLLVDSLEQIARSGKPASGTGSKLNAHGRVEVGVYPGNALEGVVFQGFTSHLLMQDGVTPANLRSRQAVFYDKKDPSGGVCVILGAGNVAAIPATDMLYKMFVEGYVCVLKINPVNEWVGPFLERAFEPLIARDYVRVTYGGGDVGAYLCEHKDVDDIHITGSDRTHDLIVWGPPGPERERRMKDNDPKLKKTITSELGNVSPVAVVPAQYTDDELWFQARNIASMVANNGSFNCNAAKMLILAKGWGQRDQFLTMIGRALSAAQTRRAYYPGAFDRYRDLTAGMARVEKFGEASDSKLPWTIIRDVDAAVTDHKLFRTEPFCGILSQTEIGSTDPAEFIRALVPFANDQVWGTLNATIIIHPRLEKDPVVGKELQIALRDLKYGTVAINHWPALGYGMVTPAWGGHPSATLQNIQSGLGWVHNTYMFEGIDKTVVRGPLVAKPKPAWFYDNKKSAMVASRMVPFFANPSWFKLPGLVFQALRG